MVVSVPVPNIFAELVSPVAASFIKEFGLAITATIAVSYMSINLKSAFPVLN
jgi:hypothetical protein